MNELIQTFNTKYNTKLNEYGIDTQLKRVHFFSQLYHESKLIPRAENLNYSAKALTSIFKKYFKSLDDANKVARKPEQIANIVYADRMGNGDVASGDGWRYRGRGFIQLTGKDNYKQFADHLNNDNILSEPDLLLSEANALISALWYWKSNKINSVINDDTDLSIQRVTKKINGGLIGIDERTALFKEIGKLKLT
ncbi:glycoside hydrolase family 19 protein [Flavobacterium daemonense]|uniref:glycoside hydrolase family 19 protein n=1 Tax=Flavobacterium daemonense TaxID=1393049 RepID=UPI00118628ED|nr:glycoside hydrolase family 19 protein [Flavobacterium daemonense]KAF2337213.1 glycoside hydrolase family 19 protein [Flavobacterium daemonense]